MSDRSRLTPSHLTAHWESPFAAWMDAWSVARAADASLTDPWTAAGGSRRDEQTDEDRLLLARGAAHEAAVLARFPESDVHRINPLARDPYADTLDAMRAGRPVIYQAHLQSDGLAGKADFLVRTDRASQLGAHSYAVWDAKLAHAARPQDVLQVCAYVDMLRAAQGVVPARCTIALGHGENWEFSPVEYLAYYAMVRREAEAFHRTFDAHDAVHPRTCTRYGRWSDLAERILDAEDHVSRVANITRSQVRRLEDAGVWTVRELADAPDAMKGLDPAVYARLRTQAALQLESRTSDRPAYRARPPQGDDPHRGLALLPPPSVLDVFFDMEGDPLTTGGFEYLFGACSRADGAITFHDWWAYTPDDERRAFEGFIDWVVERRERDPAMHIYHYAPYEVTAVRRLSTRYGTREDEVDDLLRRHVFVDLYQVVRQGLIVGTTSYSLKQIEKVYLSRGGDITSAGASVVAFNRWRDAPDGASWEDSPTLRAIRDYNEVDCASLVHLVDWLRDVQGEAGVTYAPFDDVADADAETASSDRARARDACIARLTAWADDEALADEDRRIAQLIAWLVGFHWREMKPVWWELFSKQERGEDEHYDDVDCLVCDRTAAPPVPDQRSALYEYRFDPDQNTVLDAGLTVLNVLDLKGTGKIAELDRDVGRLLLRRGVKNGEPPEHLVLAEDTKHNTGPLEEAILRCATAWEPGQATASALEDLLRRRAPRIAGRGPGAPLLSDDADDMRVERTIDLVRGMRSTTLCIQGPPGTGKTYTASHVIDALLCDGARVGVLSNSHKAIVNVMAALAEIPSKTRRRLLKVGEGDPDPRIAEHNIEWVKDTKTIEERLGALSREACVIGGTAWLFARPALAQWFDYLIVDEAGQVALANLVAAGGASRNIVLVGDQMQLAQPTRGSHPGESGQSALEYLLHGKDTIPSDMGVFLATSRRMHPDICSFVSETMYDGRLHAHPSTSAHRVTPGRVPARRVHTQAGIVFLESPHTGNSQWSTEEIAAVRDVLADLNAGRVQLTAGKSKKLEAGDVLVVAPYNAQVRRLRSAIGASAKVGTVDKFQGQEAPVVVISLAASTIEDAPRGAEFLLSRNRINVAVSRAKAVTVVIASPALLTAHCSTIEDMRRVNLLCRLHDLGSSATLDRQPALDSTATLFRSPS